MLEPSIDFFESYYYHFGLEVIDYFIYSLSFSANNYEEDDDKTLPETRLHTGVINDLDP